MTTTPAMPTQAGQTGHAAYEPGRGTRLAQAFRWHVPLMTLAALMAVVGVVAIVGILVDDRVLTGLPIWAKPTKFALSILLYSVTWAWFISQLTRLRRTAWWMGTVAAVLLGAEMVIVVGQVIRGTTSHFNGTTPLNAALYQMMGMLIVVVWVATLVVALIMFRNPGPDRARNLAVRAGSLVALVGMALGFLMTLPTKQQIAEDSPFTGAHTVGLADGGPGLPLLGWSTVAGDLRIPHFVGMHALQLIPLVLIGLELLARKVTLLRQEKVRARLVAVAVVGYLAELALLTWQALRGQSIVRPDLLTGLTFTGIVVCVGAGVLAALRAGQSRSERSLSTRSS
ncbi:hypothetical protein GCM10023317_78120 [Actinopolymorpha pittospori]